MFDRKILLSFCTLAIAASCFAEPPKAQVLSKQEALKLSSLSNSQTGKSKPLPTSEAKVKNFTGKTVGSHVRMRTGPDMESAIVRELQKDELVVVTGEMGDFYEISAPSDTKAFVFRSFILDNFVEGNHVNVRLSPNLDAPVIAHLNTGDKVQGKISDTNSKWLEIATPPSTRFYVAKEFIEYAGGADLKEVQDKRKKELDKAMEAAFYTADSEMRKPYTEMDFERLSSKFKTLMQEYQDFPASVEKAGAKLVSLQETYLQKKLEYLETKAEKLSQKADERLSLMTSSEERKEPSNMERILSSASATEKMRVWESFEEALFASWNAMHYSKSMDDFYEEQKEGAITITGTIEPYADPVKNKPGSHVVKFRDLPVCYVYSTQVNLDSFVGKKVNMTVAPRPNNNFAFPAYFVFEVAN
jgi:hypothetical protein